MVACWTETFENKLVKSLILTKRLLISNEALLINEGMSIIE